MAYPNDPPAPPTLALKSGESINTGLVGWWPLTETDDYVSGAADISGNANNGTQSGGVLSATTSIGNAASFDGTDNYISATHDATLSFDVAAGATFSVWIKPDTVAGGATFSTTNPRYILAKSPANVESSNYLLRLLGGKIDFTYRNSGNTSYVTQRSDSEVVSAGSFQHVVAVHTGTSIVLYLNGSPVASTLTSGTATDSSRTNTSDFIIGKEGLGTQRHFDGNVQNARIWNTALTAQQVSDIYTTPWLGSNYEEVVAGNTYFFPAHFGGRL